jgi:hypothetical protein
MPININGQKIWLAGENPKAKPKKGKQEEAPPHPPDSENKDAEMTGDNAIL